MKEPATLFGRGCQSLTRWLKRTTQLNSSDWRYLARAAIELFAARIRLSFVATDKILRELRAPLSERAPGQISPLTSADVERLSWAIAVASQWVPWRSDCLVQVMGADRWLRRHRLRPDFYLGIAKAEEGAFAAHAWLRWGNLAVTHGSCDQFRALIEPVAHE